MKNWTKKSLLINTYFNNNAVIYYSELEPKQCWLRWRHCRMCVCGVRAIRGNEKMVHETPSDEWEYEPARISIRWNIILNYYFVSEWLLFVASKSEQKSVCDSVSFFPRLNFLFNFFVFQSVQLHEQKKFNGNTIHTLLFFFLRCCCSIKEHGFPVTSVTLTRVIKIWNEHWTWKKWSIFRRIHAKRGSLYYESHACDPHAQNTWRPNKSPRNF